MKIMSSILAWIAGKPKAVPESPPCETSMQKPKRRRKQNRRGDSCKAPGKPRTKYRPGEGYRSRHKRRLRSNLKYQQEVREWCKESGLTLRITNGGHHWAFYYGGQLAPGSLFAEWWPSTAKLVIGKQWKQGIHTQDCRQLIRVLENHLKFRKTG